MKSLVFSNSADSPLYQELAEQLQQGHTVQIAFGGDSMLPLIKGAKNRVHLAPINSTHRCRIGECYLFVYQNHLVIHRLIHISGDTLTFRGDHNFATEVVQRTALVARLHAVEYRHKPLSCSSLRWKAASLIAVTYRSLRNSLSQQQRKRFMPYYLLTLAILMWAPLNGIAPQINNYLFGIRSDHLLHASVYIPCVWFLSHLRCALPLAMLIGLTTESIQYLLPYRSYDVNDLIANLIGIFLGWFVLYYHQRKKKAAR